MAAIFLRRNVWWVRFYHPQTRILVRESLATSDHARAELLREKIEHHVALEHPRFGDLPIPCPLLEFFGRGENERDPNEGSRSTTASSLPKGKKVQPSLLQCARSGETLPIEEAVKFYLKFCEDDQNAPRQLQNKVSLFRVLLGSDRMAEIAPFRRKPAQPTPPFFAGDTVESLTPDILLRFLSTLPLAAKTKRHYREILHHFFDVLLRLGRIEVRNAYCPNPIAALPGFTSRSAAKDIIYLRENDIERQLSVLSPHPELQAAVAVMIYAGVRRSEVLWLPRDCGAEGLQYLRVITRADPNEDIERRLKTGERTVSVSQALRPYLERQLKRSASEWLVANTDGKRWNGDTFRQHLRAANLAYGLTWTCLHYRHTFATARVASGWPLLRIARAMGNSVRVIEQHYAGFIPPEDWNLADPNDGSQGTPQPTDLTEDHTP